MQKGRCGAVAGTDERQLYGGSPQHQLHRLPLCIDKTRQTPPRCGKPHCHTSCTSVKLKTSLKNEVLTHANRVRQSSHTEGHVQSIPSPTDVPYGRGLCPDSAGLDDAINVFATVQIWRFRDACFRRSRRLDLSSLQEAY